MQHPPPPLPSPLSSSPNHKNQTKKIQETKSQSLYLPSNDSSLLLLLLRQHKTEDAYALYSRSPSLPSNPVCLSRLLAQLSHRNTPLSLSRAHSLFRRLHSLNSLHLLDSNSLGLLALASSKSPSHLPLAHSLILHILRLGYLPHLKAYSAVVSRLSNSNTHLDHTTSAPAAALRLFRAILHRLNNNSGPASPSPITSDAWPDTGAFNAALNACANLGDVDAFVSLFREMTEEFGVKPDVLSYNLLIKMCARAERKDLLGFVLERIIWDGIAPCNTTMCSLVAAYVGFGDLETAERMVEAMREGRMDICAVLRGDQQVTEPSRAANETAALECLVRPEFDVAPPHLPRKYLPNTRVYTILMKGYMKEGRVDDVVLMVRAMQREQDPASHPDHVTYTTVMSALMNAGEVKRAHSVLAEMADAGISPNLVTYNVLLKGYCQQLQLDKAMELFKEMAERAGIEPNVVTYNTLIDGCILMDDCAGALKYFSEMRERGIAPSVASYTTVMKAFAVSGQPRLAHKVFDEMEKDPRVRVDIAAWNMLVESYCRLGLYEEGKKIVEMMKESRFMPDVATYGSLANGIALARKPGEALLLWNEVQERCKGTPPFKPDGEMLDTLADVCVRAAFFKKALEIVACMEDNGISPNKTKYKRIYVEMHSKMFTSKHASRARQDRRRERKRAAEAFKFWLGLPNSYYGSEWRIEPMYEEGEDVPFYK